MGSTWLAILKNHLLMDLNGIWDIKSGKFTHSIISVGSFSSLTYTLTYASWWDCLIANLLHSNALWQMILITKELKIESVNSEWIVCIRYGVFHVDFNSDSRTRTNTVFSYDFSGIIGYNGFAPAQELDPMASSVELPQVIVPMTKNFSPLPASNIPSDAGIELWRVSWLFGKCFGTSAFDSKEICRDIRMLQYLIFASGTSADLILSYLDD